MFKNCHHCFQVEITLAYNIIASKWQEHEKCSLSEIKLFKFPVLTLYTVKQSGYKDLLKQKYVNKNRILILMSLLLTTYSYKNAELNKKNAVEFFSSRLQNDTRE